MFITAQKNEGFRKLRIWSHLLKKSLMENLIFCAVYMTSADLKNVFYLIPIYSKH